jgi:ribosomal protein L7/L12
MWTRPRTLEELIPSDVRERWDIDTATQIVWLKAGLGDAEREIAENNTIEVRYREGKMDSKIREIMKANRILTVHKMDGNIQKLRSWAVSQGKKIRLVQEK